MTTRLDAGLAVIKVPPEHWQMAAMARGMLRGYDSRWREEQSGITVLTNEHTYVSPLVNLDSGRSSRAFQIAGKLDHLVLDPSVCLVDHKTTSSDLSDDGVYWRQLAVESQPSHYELLLLANGIRVDNVTWDVARKPGIRPKKITKKYGEEVGTVHAARAVAAGVEYEDAILFEDRVALETTENPDRYFARRSAKRLRDEIAEYADELWDMQKDISQARLGNRWYRNSGACMNYGTPCRFLGVCSGHDTIDSENWFRVDDVHNELELSDGRDTLTNSRLRCFQTCRRKHYYEYELGVRRVDEIEREPLRFGTSWHQALDAWWEGDSSDESRDNSGPVSSTGQGNA